MPGKEFSGEKSPMISIERIAAILAEKDPEGLIKMGAPADEYDSEARFIHQYLKPNDDVEAIFFNINRVFQKQFGSEIKPYRANTRRKECFEAIAKIIHEEMNDSKHSG